MELDARQSEKQLLQETVSLVHQQNLRRSTHVLQVDRLQRQAQLTSQNAQNLQDELDDVKTKSLAEEGTTLGKLKQRTISRVSKTRTNTFHKLFGIWKLSQTP